MEENSLKQPEQPNDIPYKALEIGEVQPQPAQPKKEEKILNFPIFEDLKNYEPKIEF